MNPINTAMSPNPGGNAFTGNGGVPAMNKAGGISTSDVLAVVLAKLKQDNDKVSQQMQQVQGGGAQQGNGADNSQGNTDMLKLQQAVTEMNTDTSLGTNMIQGVGDTQKDTAKATH
ncbi:hypothetical protein BCh11DRAFT_00026 [Burkholderia sp. Ch1-1]|uniref:Uncharacterized protein n=1 Tax=Paraburkholderia dioscoreae TaxID=2604047 RepID=A0A5Q4YV07_9BURK|nr:MULTISPECIES: hypothetical protein [Paraburkholderia]EIF32307.1 hypothetical protein BCh11DRAFT_00026 [Burkholderia sp. Ch1-1]MDR8402039.1 hypothetical protein [Paraburkholderia sp. USG1]VVD27870.1 conserved protein of unknown function [Paraburkholderia dioscoreae]